MPQNNPKHILVVGPLAEAEDLRLAAVSADAILAVDAGFDRCAEAGIEPTCVTGDLDSVSDPSAVLSWASSGKGVLIKADRDKDISDLHIALQWCVSNQFTHASILGMWGARLDHQLAVLGVARDFASQLHIALSSPGSGEQAHVVSATESYTVSDVSIFSVMSLTADTVVSIDNARWELHDHQLLPLSDLGLSNQLKDNLPATIRVSQGVVAVITIT